MITVAKYKEGDVDKTEWREAFDSTVNDRFLKSNTFSIVNDTDDSIIAIMSFQVMWEGVAQVSMLVSDEVQKYPKSFAAEVIKARRIAMAYYKTRKVYAVINSSDKRNIRWIEWLGFVKEYTMVEAGADHQDMVGYAYVVGADYMTEEEGY